MFLDADYGLIGGTIVPVCDTRIQMTQVEE